MSKRRGYTVLELMLVVVIIVAAASITFPLASYLLERNRVSAALDQVKGRWIKLRSLAMEQGRAYTFKATDGTGQYRIEPDQDVELSADADDEPWIEDGQLPEGVIFVKDPAVLRNSTPPSGGGSPEPVVTFLPDGTASSDALLIVGVPGQVPRGLRVRGLTGTILAADLTQEERP